MSGPSRRHGMTLVELMVAIALGIILIGVVTFVWLQSSKIFTTTIHKLETYQRLRTILDIMERDLANTNRTVDMEFYADTDPDADGPERPNGHYDSSDTVLTLNGEDFRTPRDPEDPLFDSKLEFGNPGDGFDGFPQLKGQATKYLFAPAVLSPEPYEITSGYTEGRRYWRDEVYVRTFSMVEGLNRPALVHYRLVPQADGRSALRRRLWYLNENNQLVYPGTLDSPATDRTTLLTQGVADLKVAFFFKETTSQEVGSSSGVGHWYHLGDADGSWSEEATSLNKLDEARGMLSARGPRALSAYHQDQFNGMNAVSFVFEGVGRFENQLAGGVVLRGLKSAGIGPADDVGQARPFSDKNVYDKLASFPGVRPGDKFFVYGASDDDGVQSRDANGVAVDRQAGAFFPDQILTVSLIYTDLSEVWAAVKFDEPVSFFRLGNDWLGQREGGEPRLDISEDDANNAALDAGPKRTILQSFNARYRVGFLPAAFLVRLSCDDPYNKNLLQMERVIRLLQQ